MVSRTTVIAMSASLLVAGCSSARPSTSDTPTASTSPTLTVTLRAAGCEPAELHTVPGLTRFTVANRGAHAGSFTVLAGDRAVGRVEGLPSGATSSLSLRLAVGGYRIACEAGTSAGGGALVVGPSGVAPRLGQAPDLLAATTLYRSYLRDQVAQLRTATTKLRGDISSGRLTAARTPYLTARQIYSRVKGAARNFDNALEPGMADIDGAIDPDSASADTGLSRIAEGLWSGRTGGLAAVADALVTDVNTLAGRLGSMHLEAVSMAAGTSVQLGDVVAEQLAGRSGAADQLGLLEAQGVVEGSLAVLVSLGGPLRRRDAALAATVASRMASVQRSLAGLRTPSGWPATTTVAPGRLRRLVVAVDAADDSYSLIASVLTHPVGP
jgi:iron uptake system component EfeO